MKYTTEEFIVAAKKVFDYYDYSLVDYVNTKTKIKVICKEHGVFEITPNNLLRGHGCPYCYGNAKYTTEKYIAAAIKVHGNRYDYSLVVYVNSQTKIKIICREHGVFEQLPSEHLVGKGCPYCGNSVKHTNESFIAKA